ATGCVCANTKCCKRLNFCAAWHTAAGKMKYQSEPFGRRIPRSQSIVDVPGWSWISTGFLPV
ncbi:hypothetical protein, partial [Rhizobium sp. PDO1-076]|uniref:hypothetical protein n=1 Tax=Rhizobium sp. PDO1-076 TaxID=1125979 RepID=UPI001AEBAF17